jgi:hypothetical protein
MQSMFQREMLYLFQTQFLLRRLRALRGKTRGAQLTAKVYHANAQTIYQVLGRTSCERRIGLSLPDSSYAAL